MNYRKGSLTIEAAIVLPLVMIMLFSIIMSTRTYHTYNRMDNAMTQASYSLANIAYPLKEVGFLDWQEAREDEAAKFAQEIDTTLDLISNTSLSKSDSSLEQIATNLEVAILGDKNSISDWLESIELIRAEFERILGIVSEIKGVAIEVLTSLKSQVAVAGGALFVVAKKALVEWYVAKYVENYLGKEYMANVLYIDMDSLEYEGSNAFYSVDEEVSINNLITLNATYTIDIPFPIPFAGLADGIDLKNSVTVRGLAGK